MTAIRVARALVEELVAQGVRDVVLSPGSRSGPLALVLAAADAAGAVRLHVRVDERTAGFLALGLAKSSRRLVPVLTTSGTAVVNLHPALLEARHAGVAVLALTADRPATLRGTGANQTTDQIGIFPGVPCAVLTSEADRGDVVDVLAALAGASGTGPAQLDLELDEPLLEPFDPTFETLDEPIRPATAGPAPEAETLEVDDTTVVVAGDDAGPGARAFAEAARLPLLAEPTSGARTGGHTIVAYRLLLAHAELASRISRVVVFGHPTLSRPVTALLGRTDLDVVVAADDLRHFPHPEGHARLVDPDVRPVGRAVGSWLEAWLEADRAATGAIDGVLAASAGVSPYDVARAVSESVPPGGLLFVGSSNPVRDLDLVARPYAVGERRLVLANRGLAGIDGTLSSAIGATLGRPSSRALAYVGDLTFLHDTNGLLIGPDEPRPDLTVVVASDDGGSIFATLEQGAPAYATAFERVFATPTGASIGGLCEALGVAHSLVADVATLRRLLAEDVSGLRVLEVPVDRTSRRALTETLSSAVRASL